MEIEEGDEAKDDLKEEEIIKDYVRGFRDSYITE